MSRYVVYNKNFAGEKGISDYVLKTLAEGTAKLPDGFREQLTRMVGSTRFGLNNIITPIENKAWRHGWNQPFIYLTMGHKVNVDSESQSLHDYNQYLTSLGKPNVKFYSEIPEDWWMSEEHLGKDIAKSYLDEYNYYAEPLGFKKVSDSRYIPKEWYSHIKHYLNDFQADPRKEPPLLPDGSVDPKFVPRVSPEDFAKYVKYNKIRDK